MCGASFSGPKRWKSDGIKFDGGVLSNQIWPLPPGFLRLHEDRHCCADQNVSQIAVGPHTTVTLLKLSDVCNAGVWIDGFHPGYHIHKYLSMNVPKWPFRDLSCGRNHLERVCILRSRITPLFSVCLFAPESKGTMSRCFVTCEDPGQKGHLNRRHYKS